MFNGTNSLVNGLMVGGKQKVPELGMGATILMWTDRHAATVTAIVKRDKHGYPEMIEIKEDVSHRTDKNGMSESQEYAFEANPEARARLFSLRKNGRWIEVGQAMKGGQAIAIGFRDEYHDYSF